VKQYTRDIDESKLRRDRERQVIARQRDTTRRAIKDRLHYSKLVSSDKDLSIANSERQMGKPYLASYFISMLKKLIPEISVEPFPESSCAARIFLLEPTGKKKVFCYCSWPIMPEWAIVIPWYEEFPTMHQHIEPDTPLFETLQSSGFESVRGWRTILIKLILSKRLTIQAAESMFGIGQRPSWAILTKKHELKTELVA